MTISILGCGWYGLALANSLIIGGYTVKGSTTSTGKISVLRQAGIIPFNIDLAAHLPLPKAFFDCDVLVVTIPPRVRQGEGAAYLPGLKRIVAAVHEFAVKRVILISSTGVYADRNATVDENTAPTPDTPSGIILQAAEQLFVTEQGLNATIIRFGGLVGPGRDPGRFFAGKANIPNGLAPVNLIHLDDCAGITEAIIRQGLFGRTINAVTPHHPPKFAFYTRAAENAGFVLPEFVQELKEWKIVNSAVTGTELLYDYKIDDWYHWLGMKG